MKTWVLWASVNGFLAVAAGAIATHSLERQGLADAARLFDTAARYQFWHALALMGVAWLTGLDALKGSLLPRLAGTAFLVGIVLFSGSLYAYALTHLQGLVFVTPFGGVAFLAGWALLARAALKLPGA